MFSRKPHPAASSRLAIAPAAIEPLESRVLLSTYYVATTGNNANAGSSDAPWLTIQKGLSSVAAGDTLIVRDGVYNITAALDTVASGNAANRITIRAENPRGALVQGAGNHKLFNIDQQYYTIQGFIFDGAWAASDLVTPTANADFLIWRDNELRRGSKDGIDMSSPTDVLIEDSWIHDLLWWDSAANARVDAHGIVTSGAVRLTMRNNEIHYVSGDAWQGITGSWDDILIEGNNWWNGPLPTARAGFPAGANPGENAVDTKVDPASPRASLIIRNNRFHGWDSSYISNSAAMVLKQKIEAEVYNNVFYDNEIAWRYRGATGDNGAWITSYNNILYNNEVALRYEDAINNMKVYNNTFGLNNATMFKGVNGTPTNYQVYNNLFRSSSKPSIASHASNKAVLATVFVNSASHDYHLAAASTPIDGGIAVALVTTDFDGVPRPQGSAYDPGAYEWQSNSVAGTAGNDTFYILRAGDNVQVHAADPPAGAPIRSYPVATFTTLAIDGLGGDDRLVVDLSGGNPFPSGGISFTGGAHAALGDRLEIIGGAAVGAYLPSGSTSGNGTVTVGGGSISLTGVEEVRFRTIGSVSLLTPNSNDALALAPDAQAGFNRVTGSSGGIPMASLSYPAGAPLTLSTGSGSDTLTVSNTTTTLDLVGNSIALTADGGAMVNLASSPTLAGLTINSAARVNLLAHGGRVLTTGSLAITDGTLDVADNKVLVPYSGISPIQSITAALAAGYAGGGWGGTSGIVSSMAAGAMSVGVRDDGAGLITIAYTLAGDSNLDYRVDFDDLLVLSQFYGTPGNWAGGDFTYDGQVNFDDLLILSQMYGSTWSPPAAAMADTSATSASLLDDGSDGNDVSTTALFSDQPILDESTDDILLARLERSRKGPRDPK